MDGELRERTWGPRISTARDFAGVFFRHRALFVGSLFAVLTAGMLFTTLSASYRAESKFIVRRGRFDPVISPTATAAPLLRSEAVTEEELNSEVDLLQSHNILREVTMSTGLAQRNSWLSWLRREDPEQKAERAVQHLEKNLSVRPVRKSQVITVSYQSADPRLAVAVLKSLEEVYLSYQARTRRPRGQQMFFDEQTRIAKRDLQRTQRDMEDFTRQKKVVSASLERDLTLQKLSEAQSAQFAVQAALEEVVSRVRSLDDRLQQLPPRKVSQLRNTDNPQLQEKLKSKLLDLELRRTQLLTRFEASYRLVQEVDQQIAQTKTSLAAENLTPLRDELTEDNPDYAWANSERVKAGVELAGLRKRAEVAKDQVAQYQARAQDLGRNAIEQNEIEQNLKVAEDKYLLYAGKREEARIGDALDQTGILNVAVAETAHVPALPRLPLWIAISLCFGAALVFSTAAVFFADYVDPSIRTPGDVVALLGIPVLASFPSGPPAGPRNLRVA